MEIRAHKHTYRLRPVKVVERCGFRLPVWKIKRRTAISASPYTISYHPRFTMYLLCTPSACPLIRSPSVYGCTGHGNNTMCTPILYYSYILFTASVFGNAHLPRTGSLRRPEGNSLSARSRNTQLCT